MLDLAEEKDFDDSSRSWAKRWQMEIDAARKETKKWHDIGEKIVKRFKDERDGSSNEFTRINLFTANVQTLRALLYGKTPKVEVKRRFADSQDDAARAAAEMLERLLNTDIERGGDTYAIALEHALDDRLMPGLGNVRARYVAKFEQQVIPPQIHPVTGRELAPAVTQDIKTDEDVEIDYVYWRDQLWSPARVFSEVRWWAFKAEMSRDELVRRFGKEIGKEVPLNAKRSRDNDTDSKNSDPWSRADVWEIQSKEYSKTFWWVEGHPEILDVKENPLGLDGFWSFPRPMFANTTTSSLVPRPDFTIAQDIYNEIDTISTRITLLERAIRVAGAYDESNPDLKRLLSETSLRNELVAVKNWMQFAEKGGLAGSVDWLNLEFIVNALDKLRDYRTELMNLLFQVTGMSDIMRGQAATNTTATEQSIKAKFASVRVQAFQDEFARFASGVQQIKAEIISKHFDAATIIARSNIMNTPDAPLAEQAAQLLKSDISKYRIEVKPEAVSLTDYASLKMERTEFLQAMAGFLTSMAPVAQGMPGSMPYLLQMLQWGMAGFRGSSTIEGVLDQAIAAAQQAEQQRAAMPPQPPPPDPKIVAAQMKAQHDQQKGQMDLQSDLVRMHAETQQLAQRKATDAHINVLETAATERAKSLSALNHLIPPGTGGVP